MKEYKTISRIAGPLVFVEKTDDIAYGELVEIDVGNGEKKNGQVLDTSKEIVVVQVFEGTSGIGKSATVKFTGKTIKLNCSEEMLGRVLSGLGKPLDNGPEIIPEEKLDVNGAAINPYARDSPRDFLQTGVSTIDGMNTLVKGQKLPIFSGSGLPHNEIALQIARQAKVEGNFAVIFAAMGITNEEAQQFIRDFEQTGALKRTVVFLNLADDPTIERLITPRMALTAAEYLAYTQDMNVLVILTDMTNYCEALREIGAAREEVPGRRGYPGYMYTDLASIYERAGLIKGKKGSVTQIPILTMPGDDITHPIPDLTGYITEGQIVLGRELHRSGIYAPIDVLPCLSRLMNLGIGKDQTRDDHKALSNQLYAGYAEGRSLRGLVAIVGEEALSERDQRFLAFARDFENNFVKQGKRENRTIAATLNLGWRLLTVLPKSELTRIDDKLIEKYSSELGLSFGRPDFRELPQVQAEESMQEKSATKEQKEKSEVPEMKVQARIVPSDSQKITPRFLTQKISPAKNDNGKGRKAKPKKPAKVGKKKRRQKLAEIKPTRSELIKLKRKIKLAQSGHSLLKKKRDGLIKEFFDVLKEAKKSKSAMQENYAAAKTAINLARAVDGTAAVRSASFALKQEAEIELQTRNVMGIVVPKIRSDHHVQAFHARGYGIIGTGGYIDDAAEGYEKVLGNIITAAEIETTLKKLLAEIDKTKRRVNALEFRVVPKMKAEAKFISLRLEEMEREDIFRLKKIKKKEKK